MNMEMTSVDWEKTRELAQVASSNATEKDLAFAVEIGKIQALQSIADLSRASVFKWFYERKENNDYKGVKLVGKEGVFTPNSFEELCEGMGYSRSSIYEEIQNFKALGENLYEPVKKLGLPRAMMRDFRSAVATMPEEEREIAEQQFYNADEDALRDWIADLLIEKNSIENDKKQAIESGNKAKATIEKLDKELISTKRELNEYKNPSGKLQEKENEIRYHAHAKEFAAQVQLLNGHFARLVALHNQYLDLADELGNKEAYTETNALVALSLTAIHNQLQNSRFDVDLVALFDADFDVNQAD